MNEFKVGDKVTILDVNKQGEVTAVSEDGQVTVKYTDEAGAEATETGTADKFGPAGASEEAAAEGEMESESSDESKEEEESESAE
jgi:hypothetical protein